MELYVVAYASAMDADGIRRECRQVSRNDCGADFRFFSPSAFTCWSRVIRTRAFSRAHAYFVRAREQFLLGRLPRVCLSGCSCCWHRHWLTKLYAVWSSLRVALAIRKFMQILAVSYFISSRCGKTDATFCHHLVDLRPYLMLNYGQTVSNEYKLRKKRK